VSFIIQRSRILSELTLLDTIDVMVERTCALSVRTFSHRADADSFGSLQRSVDQYAEQDVMLDFSASLCLSWFAVFLFFYALYYIHK
jgi:hypothetical protein